MAKDSRTDTDEQLVERVFKGEKQAFDLLVLYAAMPSASSAYILAMRMGGDGPGVAWLISATTILAMPTLTVWLALL